MYMDKYNVSQKCLDSEQSSAYLLHLQVSYIYINRLCACSPYKCCLYTKLHALNCTHVQVHLIYRRNPHGWNQGDNTVIHTLRRTRTHTHTHNTRLTQNSPCHIPLKEQSNSRLSGTNEGNVCSDYGPILAPTQQRLSRCVSHPDTKIFTWAQGSVSRFNPAHFHMRRRWQRYIFLANFP